MTAYLQDGTQIEYFQCIDACTDRVEALTRAKKIDPWAVYLGIGYLEGDEYCEEPGEQKLYHLFGTM